MIKKYVKKPVPVEAILLTKDTVKEIEEWSDGDITCCVQDCAFHPNRKITMKIKSLLGPMNVEEGNYIIKGIGSDFYTCDKDIFEDDYSIYVPKGR